MADHEHYMRIALEEAERGAEQTVTSTARENRNIRTINRKTPRTNQEQNLDNSVIMQSNLRY